MSRYQYIFFAGVFMEVLLHFGDAATVEAANHQSDSAEVKGSWMRREETSQASAGVSSSAEAVAGIAINERGETMRPRHKLHHERAHAQPEGSRHERAEARLRHHMEQHTDENDEAGVVPERFEVNFERHRPDEDGPDGDEEESDLEEDGETLEAIPAEEDDDEDESPAALEAKSRHHAAHEVQHRAAHKYHRHEDIAAAAPTTTATTTKLGAVDLSKAAAKAKASSNASDNASSNGTINGSNATKNEIWRANYVYTRTKNYVCNDLNFTGILFSDMLVGQPQKEASCQDLASYCFHETLGQKVRDACLKTCGFCDVEAVTNEDPYCVDRDATASPVYRLDGRTADCHDLAFFCKTDPTIYLKCKLSCGACNPQSGPNITEYAAPTVVPATLVLKPQNTVITTVDPTVSTTIDPVALRAIYRGNLKDIYKDKADTTGGMGCSRRRLMGFCVTRRRREA